MPITVSELSTRCRELLASEPGPEGRARVAGFLSEVLADPDNVEVLIPQDTGERHLLYQDPEMGFCILAHQYKAAKESSPHDHGPSWAVYAQARGETEMKDYELAVTEGEEKPARVKAVRSYRMKPGDAHVYNEGDIHAPFRSGPTSLIRIEGTDMTQVNRRSYEVA